MTSAPSVASRPRRLAFLGCAHIHTDRYVRLIGQRADVTTAWVWDHDGERASRYAAATGAAPAPGPSTVLADPQVDGVVVCAETVRQRDLVLAAVRAGKHIFVEKPFGLAASDADEMAAAVDAAGITFQAGYFHRGHPANRFLHGEIERGHLGRLTRARVSMTHAGALEGWFDGDWRWMADREQAGFGGFGDMALHAVDVLLWLLAGERRLCRVTASVSAVSGRYEPCDEYGEGLLVFDDGVMATVAAGWASVGNPVTLELCGTEGHAHVVNDRLYYRSRHVEGASGREAWQDLPDALPHAFDLFCDALAGRSDVELVGAREAAARSAVARALDQAARDGAWIALG
ncbi:MAG TPA: Gfo/Idh/MocA family oxidoreductase [Terriglobales bacterium]|nr:Gfo/Idh/MocA family oxidoreductase [Terriglobales bacterium]